MGMVVVYDLEGVAHEKESADASECVNECGWSMTPPPESPAAREDMKAFLTAKGVEFAANIKQAALTELYNAEKAKE